MKIKNHKKILHIKLHSIKSIKDKLNSTPQTHYISFQHDKTFYFSSSLTPNKYLNEDILVPLKQKIVPEYISLLLWKNQMVMFNFQISLNQLKSRIILKRNYQIYKSNILSFTITLFDSDQIIFADQFIQSISQHYLMIKNIKLKNQQPSQLSYYVVQTSNAKYIIPAKNGVIYAQLPQKFQFYHYQNGKIISNTQEYASDQICQPYAVLSFSQGQWGKIQMELKWGINLHENKIQNNLLLEVHQLLVYDICVKIQTQTVLNNCTLKLIYGSKSFQIDQIHVNGNATNKFVRFRKIIHCIIKSQDQQFNIIIQRKQRVVAYCRLFTDQIYPFMVNSVKKNITQVQNGKIFGIVKFKSQKGKTLSVPNNNQVWKQVLTRKKSPPGKSIFILLSQLSISFPTDVPITIIVKTQNQQKTVKNINNINYYKKKQPKQQQQQISMYVRPQQSVYLMVRKKQNNSLKVVESDFIGIGVINISQIQLGESCLMIGSYHNKVQTSQINLLINKITYDPFTKSTYHPQNLHLPNTKSISISIIIKDIILTAYYYSYRYDNKNQLYCIVDMNRTRKVLILDKSPNDELYFISVAGSDILNFTIDDQDYIKVKLTILISDIGHQEQIYGTSFFKFKTIDLQNKKSIINSISIINDYGTIVGDVKLQARRIGQKNKNKQQQKQHQNGPFNSQIRKVKQQITKVNQSLQRLQKSKKAIKNNYSPIKQNYRYNSKKNYSIEHSNKLKLPKINQYKLGSIEQLIQNMRIRKRNNGGKYNKSKAHQYHQKPTIFTERSMKQQQIKNKIIANQNKLLNIQSQRNNSLSENISNLNKNFIPNEMISIQNQPLQKIKTQNQFIQIQQISKT